jgi:hypothetical protein
MSDFISGKHVTTRIYIATLAGAGPTPWNISIKSTRVQEVAEEAADGVCGENRDRLQKITNYYRVTQECYDNTEAKLLTTWLTNQKNEDAVLPQLAMAGGMLFKFLDTSAIAFTMTNCTLGPLDYNISGRTARNMATVMYRCQYFNPASAA